MGRLRRFAAVIGVAGGMATGCQGAFASDACPGDDQVPTMDTAQQAAAALVCDLNELRAQRALPPLSWNGRLWSAAQGMADDMAQQHFISHETPDGRDLFDRVKPTGYTARSDDWLLLENLGWASGQAATPNAIAGGWMSSQGHRLNIMDPDIRELGIGISQGSPGGDHGDGIFYAVDFGARHTHTTAARRTRHSRPRR